MTRRKIVVDGKEYKYVIGRQMTKVDGVGSISNMRLGYCTDVSMDQYLVTPRDVSWFIRTQEVHRLYLSENFGITTMA